MQLAISSALVVLAAWSAHAQTCSTAQLTVGAGGAQPDGDSTEVSISADGRLIAFWSEASNLVAGDTNGFYDTFVVDRTSGVITRTSVATGSVQANGHSTGAAIAGNGRYVAFQSIAPNLVNGGGCGVFVRELATGVTTRADVSVSGGAADDQAFQAHLDYTGRFATFSSYAGNLVLGDVEGQCDVFVRDMFAGVTTRVSVDSSGVGGDGTSLYSVLSADGRFVAFRSNASNFDSADHNGTWDIYVHDRANATTELASVAVGGGAGNGLSAAAAISADGRFVVFESNANDLVAGDTNSFRDIFLRDRTLGLTRRVSQTIAGVQSDRECFLPSISPDGRSVVFLTAAPALTPAPGANGKVHALRVELASGAFDLVDVAFDGSVPAAHCYACAISADGGVAALASRAPNLTNPPVINGAEDIFVRICAPAAATSYCIAQVNSVGCTPAIAATGSASASTGSGFDVTASNVVSNKFGLLFYGTNGADVAPFRSGYRCVKNPLHRTAQQLSNGNPFPNDCSGAFHFDFNAFVAGGTDPSLVAATQVWAQYWSRDPQAATTTNLSDAITFAIGP